MNDKTLKYINLMAKSVKDSELVPELYKPSSFWAHWVDKLSTDMNTFGFNHFKETASCHALFVAHYGYPFNEISDDLKNDFIDFAQNKQLSKKQVDFLELYLSGKMNAISDYRVLCAADDGPSCGLDFSKFSEGNIGSPQEQFDFDGQLHSRHSLNYLHQLSFLKKCMGDFSPKTYMEIGGGWGSLGEVLLKSCTLDIKYIDIDIPPSCIIAEYYLKETFPSEKVYGYSESKAEDNIVIKNLPRLTVIPSWKIEKLQGQIDVFINSISFQEMEPVIVQSYLKTVARLKPKFILLRNLREGKNIEPDSGNGSHVIEPVERGFYINCLIQQGYQLYAENVIPFGRKTIDGFHSEILVFSI